MALKDRIDILNGLTNLAATVTNLLNLEAPSYIRYIPDDLVRQFTTNSTDSGSGVTLGSGRFVYAHKSGRRAQLRDSAEKAALEDAGSLHLATTLTPASYVENGKAYVLPGGGTVVAVLATTLNSSSDDSISFLPASLSDAVQIKVAWRLLAYSFYTRAFPYTAPAAPEVEYIPAGFSEMGTAAFAALPAAPTYTTQAVLATSDAWSDTMAALETALDADDVELARGRLEKAAQYLDELGSRIQNQQGVFASNKALFDAEITKRQADIQALVEKYRLDAQQETSVDLQNQAQKAATELQNYSLSLQRYQQTFNAWVAEKQGQQQMLNNLLQQHEIIMANFAKPEKAVQKVYVKQPVEAEA